MASEAYPRRDEPGRILRQVVYRGLHCAGRVEQAPRRDSLPH